MTLCQDLEGNVRPKLDFLRREVFDGDSRRTILCAATRPRILSSSLDKRLRPRVEEAKGCAMEIHEKRLLTIATQTDADWSEMIRCHRLGIGQSRG